MLTFHKTQIGKGKLHEYESSLRPSYFKQVEGKIPFDTECYLRFVECV